MQMFWKVYCLILSVEKDTMEVWVNGGVVETAVSLIVISLPLAYNHI